MFLKRHRLSTCKSFHPRGAEEFLGSRASFDTSHVRDPVPQICGNWQSPCEAQTDCKAFLWPSVNVDSIYKNSLKLLVYRDSPAHPLVPCMENKPRFLALHSRCYSIRVGRPPVSIFPTLVCVSVHSFTTAARFLGPGQARPVDWTQCFYLVELLEWCFLLKWFK